MGCGDVCLLNDEGHRAIEGSSRPLLINLTVPSVQLHEVDVMGQPIEPRAGQPFGAEDLFSM